MNIYRCVKCGRPVGCTIMIPDKEDIACYSLCLITGYNDVAEWKEDRYRADNPDR